MKTFFRLLVLSGSLWLARSASAEVLLNYWMWESTQLPAYRAAARAFEAGHPGIRVHITQIGWYDYWISLTTAMLSETAPDVFINHISRFPELQRNGTLLDLSPFVARDGVDPAKYISGLYEPWGKDGYQYGLPKDWDTVAIVYNRELLTAAGVSPAELEELTWNPQDGGTFAQVLARLSRDHAGHAANDPAFNPREVTQYALLIDGRTDGFGQVEWSHFAASNGFTYYEGPWSRRFRFDDPRLAETIQWLRDASQQRGWIIPARDARQIGANGLFAAGRGALALTGSWMIDWYGRNCRFPIGFAPLPIGPTGRKTMFNGLADSIFAGTHHAEEAWQWVRFLGSPEGQAIIAQHGVVFPSLREAAEQAAAVMSKRVADVSVFLRQATTPGGTFGHPVADHTSDIRVLTTAAMDKIFLNGEEVSPGLQRMNEEVNQLFAE